jgi:multiple sugar transport system substrate-binding protein
MSTVPTASHQPPRPRSRRPRAGVASLAAPLLAAALVVAACGGGSSGGPSSSSSSASGAASTAAGGTGAEAQLKPATVTLWVGFTQRELKIIKGVVAGFERAHPGVKVKTVGGISDDKIVAAIRGGNAPDVAQSFSTDNTGSFCASGAWADLGPRMKADGISPSQFPKAVQTYTKFAGKQCAMPMLADVYGLYYNKSMFAKAGIKSPPRTFSELTADAKKLTKRKADGSIEVAGFNPTWGFYENAVAHYAPLYDAQWTKSDGSSNLAGDPRWQKLLQWQKSLVDWYGYDKLVRFNAGAGDEFSASNAFETGKVAMAIDGEFRTAFLADEHPELKYGTAPMPVDDGQPQLYGAGYVTGNIAGIPKGAKHPDQAWALLKYLALDPKAESVLSNELKNVPTTTAALRATQLRPTPEFKPFLRIFAHPKTQTNPINAAGSADQELFEQVLTKYQAGKVPDLHAALAKLDEQIDAQVEQASGPQVP